MKYLLLTLCLCLSIRFSHAQTSIGASVSYTPTWQARHHLQLLADNAGLPLTVSHWPLPAAAVRQALDRLVLPTQANADWVKVSRDFVLNEVEALQSRNRVQLQLRPESEGLGGYGENYTPGSSTQAASAEGRWVGDALSAAGRLGARVEANSNSMPAHLAGASHESDYQLRLQGTEAVLGWGGWNIQVFSRQNWWSPGWQGSLVNGHNNPAWLGAGLQRGSVEVSDSAWLSWMGPWNLELFVAKGQDPQVVQKQPRGFLFSGMRLTMKPTPWLELGLSRGLQFGGAGRPDGLKDSLKAFFGIEVNQDPGDPPDTSGQIAGYDARVRCPVSWGGCAAYFQWMGEDAAGTPIQHPFKFMSLWGVEKTLSNGRYRVFAEWIDANGSSLPWETRTPFPGFVNGVYNQGYTQGARWVGPAQGSGSQVLTLGWMDAGQQRQFRFHVGNIFRSVGVYSPTVNAPHGDMWGASASQTLHWKGLMFTPELGYTHLAEGDDQPANKRNNVRVGLTIAMPL